MAVCTGSALLRRKRNHRQEVRGNEPESGVEPCVEAGPPTRSRTFSYLRVSGSRDARIETAFWVFFNLDNLFRF